MFRLKHPFLLLLLSLVKDIPYPHLHLVAGTGSRAILKGGTKWYLIGGIQVRITKYRFTCVNTGGFYSFQIQESRSVGYFKSPPVFIE